jgi:pyruvate dehydrogenase E2 component (dihydrolipoamide acetyltransferase)
MVTPLVVPQVNLNDETVRLVAWRVPDGGEIVEGAVACEVETTKAVSEVQAHATGILRHSRAIGVHVRVGEAIGAIGPTNEAVEAYLAATPLPTAAAESTVTATPKARALAAAKDVSLDDVLRGGVHGTIKESDVRRFLGERDTRTPTSLPAGLMKYLEREGPLPAFDAAVAQGLRRSVDRLVLTSIDMTCRLTSANAAIERAHAAGRMMSVLHLTIAAVARSLPAFPRLMSVAHEGSLYRYRAIDVAFIARTPDGRLFTPVIKAADRLTVNEIAAAAQGATIRLMRGGSTAGLKIDELEGAAFTISQVAVPGTTRVAALPSLGQSAILGLSAERPSLEVVDAAAVIVPVLALTLSYDHALCDGVYAASFLAAVVHHLEHLGSAGL